MGPADPFVRGNVSQRYGVDLAAANGKAAAASGDADLPLRTSLSDRRARTDSVSCRPFFWFFFQFCNISF